MDISKIKAKLQMVGSRILRLDIKNDFVFIDETKGEVSRQIDVSYKLGDVFTLDEEEKSIAGNITIVIEIQITSKNNRADIGLEIEGCFELESSNDENLLKEMLQINGSAALYSVARGIISSVTSHMCTNGTVLIPMLNMYELKSESKSSNY